MDKERPKLSWWQVVRPVSDFLDDSTGRRDLQLQALSLKHLRWLSFAQAEEFQVVSWAFLYSLLLNGLGNLFVHWLHSPELPVHGFGHWWKFVLFMLRVCSSAWQNMSWHFLRWHFGDLAKILVPLLCQGKMAWHFVPWHFGDLEKFLVT